MNFIMTPLFAKVYEASKYGIFTYLYSAAAMLNAFLAFGMETTFFRYLQKREREKEKVYGNTFLIILLTSLLLLLSFFIFFNPIASYLQQQFDDPDLELYLKYFVLIMIADALAVIPFARIRAEGRPGRYAFIKLTNITIYIGLNLIFMIAIPEAIARHAPWGIAEWLIVWYKGGWVGYVFIANLAASTITLILLLPELLQLRIQPDRRLILDMLGYSFPILIANFSFIINENLDKLLLKALLPADTGIRDVGIYGMCSKLAIFMSVAVQAFRLGAEPFFFSHAKEKNAGTTYANIMDYLIIAMALGMVGLVANIEWLKFFIRGGTAAAREEYWSGLPVVPVLLMAYVCLGIYMNLSVWYKLSDQTRFGLYISVVGAVVTIVLNLTLIPHFGYMASAWITLATYASMMVLSYVLGQKNYPIPYHLLKNCFYLFSAALLSWISFSIFNRSLWIGNLLFLFFAAVVYRLEGKKLLQLMRGKEII